MPKIAQLVTGGIGHFLTPEKNLIEAKGNGLEAIGAHSVDGKPAEPGSSGFKSQKEAVGLAGIPCAL